MTNVANLGLKKVEGRSQGQSSVSKILAKIKFTKNALPWPIT